MTATEELRRLLDERGIEHMDFNMPERSLTLFAGDEHDGAYTENSVDTILTVYGASPEQAVESTLGRGTCRMEKRHMDWRCTGCGEIVGTDDPTSELFIDGNAVELWRYCPNCGRAVDA